MIRRIRSGSISRWPVRTRRGTSISYWRPAKRGSWRFRINSERGAGDPLYHSILEITGRYPLVGYFTYSTLDGGDDVSYPLQDDTHFKSTLSLPHYPGNDGYWWTGIVVCNPSLYAETVKIEPYDHDGNLMEGSAISIHLDAGTYDVFEVASRFGESASAISFIRFRTEGDSGVIGGFYLYGDRGNRILSGTNM